jgi:nicotinamidase-related amidase
MRFDLTPLSSSLLLIDVQERFAPVIPVIAEDQPVGRACKQLMTAAKLLGVPTTISEQYPKGLGPTLPYLVAANPEAARLEKMHFSCGDDPTLRAHLDALHRPEVVICGIETHVCVLHTSADLLAQGKSVVIAADAVGSRKDANRDFALAALRDLGALLLPVESIVMRWTRVAGTPVFKQISALIK